MTNLHLYKVLVEQDHNGEWPAVYINLYEISSIVQHKTIPNASAIHMNNGHCYTTLLSPSKEVEDIHCCLSSHQRYKTTLTKETIEDE